MSFVWHNSRANVALIFDGASFVSKLKLIRAFVVEFARILVNKGTLANSTTKGGGFETAFGFDEAM